MNHKTLFELVEEGAFRPMRHQRLLAEDRSLFDHVMSDADPEFEPLMKLTDLQLAFRSSAYERERLAISRAFGRGANRGDWGGYRDLFGDVPGLDWRWDDGRFVLASCGCEKCEPARHQHRQPRGRLEAGRVATAPE